MVKKKKGAIAPTNIRIEKLKEAHIPFFEDFESEHKDLVNFLKEDALSNQNKLVSVTYLAFYIDKEPKLLGYITLLTDSVSLKGLKPKLKEMLAGKGMDYPTLPAIKIGRLCVDDRYRKMGLGKMFFLLTLDKLSQVSQSTGCRFITIDAKQDKDGNGLNALRYYKEKLGFELLKKRNKKHPPMYYDAYKIIKDIRHTN